MYILFSFQFIIIILKLFTILFINLLIIIISLIKIIIKINYNLIFINFLLINDLNFFKNQIINFAIFNLIMSYYFLKITF